MDAFDGRGDQFFAVQDGVGEIFDDQLVSGFSVVLDRAPRSSSFLPFHSR